MSNPLFGSRAYTRNGRVSGVRSVGMVTSRHTTWAGPRETREIPGRCARLGASGQLDRLHTGLELLTVRFDLALCAVADPSRRERPSRDTLLDQAGQRCHGLGDRGPHLGPRVLLGPDQHGLGIDLVPHSVDHDLSGPEKA